MDEFAKENKLPRKLDKNELIRFVHVWYKGSDTYEGKFDDIQIRNLIYMKIGTTHEKHIFLKQEQIEKLFESKPVLCIKQNMFRVVPKGKEREKMYLVDIDFIEQEASNGGFYYYPVEIWEEKSKKRIETIEKQFEKVDNDESDSSATV